MKKHIYIVSIGLALGLISCEKTEFSEVYHEVEQEASAKEGGSESGDNITAGSNPIFETEVEKANPDNELLKDKEKIEIQIKEVSDGDDEADDGDDSKNSD